MSPTERLLTILRCLRGSQRRGESSMMSSSIKDAMAGVYDGDSGDRKWRRDIRILRERGLIRTDLPPDRKGITLRRPRKAPNLHLTWDEHAAINHARDVLRPGMPAAFPLQSSSGEPALEMDELTRVLRFIEEQCGEVELARLARLLEVEENRVFELLDIMRQETVFGADGLVPSFVVGYRPEESDDTDDDPVPETVSVHPMRIDPRRPTYRVGLAQLGFFPYSRAETDERLTLIDEALGHDDLAAEVGPELRSARDKLTQWRSELRR